MIANDLAQPIVQTASKAYVKKYDPNKPTFQVIFHELWNPFLSLCKEKLITIPQYILYEVARMIACGTLDMGFEVYECPNCHRHHIICYTCKSRFCPSCGSKLPVQERTEFQSPLSMSITAIWYSPLMKESGLISSDILIGLTSFLTPPKKLSSIPSSMRSLPGKKPKRSETGKRLKILLSRVLSLPFTHMAGMPHAITSISRLLNFAFLSRIALRIIMIGRNITGCV